MSDAALETLSIWLFAPSLVVLTVVAVASYAKSPRRTDPIRRKDQILALESKFRGLGADQPSSYIDWLDYKELTKSELIGIAAENSWRFVDQEITSTGWLVRFEPSQDSVGDEAATS